jgi:hypothetical protein
VLSTKAGDPAWSADHRDLLARGQPARQNEPALSVAKGEQLVLDGPGFHVDVDKVDEAARGIHDSVQDQHNFELRGLCGDPDLYGHAGIHDALMDVCVRWSDGLDILTEDAGTIGDALSKVSQAYRAVDESTARSLPNDPGVGAVDSG